jgi:hypothetical protein
MRRASLIRAGLLLAAAGAGSAPAETPVIYEGPLQAGTLASFCAAHEDDATGGRNLLYCWGYVRAVIDVDRRFRRHQYECRHSVERIVEAIAARASAGPADDEPELARDLVVRIALPICAGRPS